MSLAKKTASAVAWVTLITIFTRILSFVTQLVLARILSPADFGLLAIGLLAINSMGIFQDLGFGATLIYKKDDTDHTAANTAFILLPLFALALFLIAYFSAPYIATFFNNAAVGPIVQVLALTFVISSFGTVPSMLLEKELEFKKKVMPETVPIIGYAFVAILLAMKGYGVWSLVYGQIVSAILTAGLIWLISDWRPTFKFDLNIAKVLFDYGKHLMGASIIIFLVTNVDDAIVGRVLGMEALGFYTLAYTISNLPATQITNLVSRVMFPLYSKLQDDRDALRSAYLKTLQYVSMLSIPAALGIFVIAPNFVSVMLGDKWLPAVPAMRVLCIYGLFRSLNGTIGPMFQATGNPKVLENTALVNLILFCIFLIPLIQKSDIIVVSIAGTLPQIIIFYILTKLIPKIIDLDIWDMFRTIRIFAFSGVVATIFTLLLGLYFTSPSIISLVISIIMFALIYITIIIIFDRNIFSDFKSLDLFT